MGCSSCGQRYKSSVKASTTRVSSKSSPAGNVSAGGTGKAGGYVITPVSPPPTLKKDGE